MHARARVCVCAPVAVTGGGCLKARTSQAQLDLSVGAEGRVVPPNPEDDKSHLKETVKHGHCIKSSVKVNYKIYESLIEWASGE